MRYLATIVGVALLVCMSTLSAQMKGVNFAGNWALNADKSDLGESSGGRRGGAPSKMTVTQEGNKLVVETVRRGRNGEMTVTMTYTLDGKECKNESRNRSSVSTAKWSDDGKMLTINTKTTASFNGRDFSFDSVEIWSLADGHLNIDATRTSQRGERKTKLVYDKS